MPIVESLIANAIYKIINNAAKKRWRKLKRNEKVLKIFDALDLKPGAPGTDFESVYAHTLVEYGVEKREPTLNFFRHEDIRKAFKKSFETDDFSILSQEAQHLIEWNKIGDDLRDQNIDPRLEFASFTLVFHEMVDRTRSPAEARRDRKIDEILDLIKQGNIGAIRVKNLEMIQGDLADQLKAWFKTLGYSLGSYNVQTDEYSEWVIRIPGRRGYDRILVRCIERQTEANDLEGLKLSMEKQQPVEGWLISARRKSQSACEIADQDDRIFCYTFDELLDEQADFSRYFNWLERFVNERSIEKNYVPLACRRDIIDPTTKEKTGEERYDRENGWMKRYIDRWLDDPCKEHISILGEFGTGKTWFTHHYAHEMMQRYLDAKEKGLKRPRLPLVIQLRDYSKALNSKSLFSDFFFRKHEIPLPGYSAFEQLNRMGRLLLIFDGFDEMADKLDRQKMINNFWELARVVVPGAKAILTCRTEHFPNAKEGRDMLSAELKASTANLTGDPPQFEVLELERFDEEQIRTALSKRTDQKTVELIMGQPELLDLASRPVMLEFILEALPDIDAHKLVDLSRIYLYAISAKLERDIKSERTFTSMADKLYFMCELSWEMLSTENMSLNYRLFPERLKNLFGSVVSEEKDLDHWHYDMMGNTLLIRNDDGDYSPAHRSLLEFFVAYRATAHLGMLPPDFVALVRNQSNIDEGSKPVDYDWNSYFRRETDEEGNIKPIAPLKGFCAENSDVVLDWLGRMGDAVLRFVHEITNADEVRLAFHEMLARLLDEFKADARDPEKQQNIIRFILKFRTLSQEWEEQADRGDSLRRFWKNRLETELDAGRGKIKTETLTLERPGSKPVEIEMKQISAGSFLMGDERDGPVHRVEITKPFLIAMVPVTQGLYHAVTGERPGEFEGDDLPVERVTWIDAVEFCNSLSKTMNLEPVYRIDNKEISWNRESLGFRLPTEAEWEYACRAGTSSCFACGDLASDLEAMAWFSDNSEGKTHPVGRKEPNAWGLFDMHGNVWEWVWDWYGRYPGGSVTNPIGPAGKGSIRAMRGGGWDYSARYCRSAIRVHDEPDDRNGNVGFRLSRSVSLGP